MTDVRNEHGEVIGHTDPQGEEGVEGTQGNYDAAPTGAEHGGTVHPEAKVDDLTENFLDGLEVDEEALAKKQEGGGEAILDDEADCEGCKI